MLNLTNFKSTVNTLPVNTNQNSGIIRFPQYSFSTEYISEQELQEVAIAAFKELKPLNKRYNQIMQQLDRVNEQLENLPKNISKAQIQELQTRQSKLQQEEEGVRGEIGKFMNNKLHSLQQTTERKKELKDNLPKTHINLKGIPSDDYYYRIKANREYAEGVNKADYIKRAQEAQKKELPTLSELKAQARQEKEARRQREAELKKADQESKKRNPESAEELKEKAARRQQNMQELNTEIRDKLLGKGKPKRVLPRIYQGR